MGTHYRVKIPILSILRSTISTACHLAPVERVAELSCCHIGHSPIHCWNSYVSEMQLWFVAVSSNELDQCPIWDTRRLDAVYDTNGLAMTILMEHWLILSGTEDWRLLLSTLIVRYKCCVNVVVFLAFRYVALALGVMALLTSLAETNGRSPTVTSRDGQML